MPQYLSTRTTLPHGRVVQPSQEDAATQPPTVFNRTYHTSRMTAGVHRYLCTNNQTLLAFPPHAHPNEPEPRTVRVLRVTPAPAPSCVRAAETSRKRSQNCGWTSGERQLRGGWWSSIPPEPTAFTIRLRAVGRHLLAYTCVHAGSWACLRTVPWQTACASACIHLQHSRLVPRGQSPPKHSSCQTKP
jgi:hypothetical protein